MLHVEVKVMQVIKLNTYKVVILPEKNANLTATHEPENGYTITPTIHSYVNV